MSKCAVNRSSQVKNRPSLNVRSLPSYFWDRAKSSNRGRTFFSLGLFILVYSKKIIELIRTKKLRTSASGDIDSLANERLGALGNPAVQHKRLSSIRQSGIFTASVPGRKPEPIITKKFFWGAFNSPFLKLREGLLCLPEQGLGCVND